MLDESGYRRFVDAIRDPARLSEHADPDPAFRVPILVDILVARVSGSVWRQVWQQIGVTPFDLVQIWHRRQLDLLALSVPVTLAHETKRTCITRCADGTIQEALCSETADDIINCTDAITQRCGTGGTAARLRFIAPPASTEGSPRVRHPEPA